MNDISCIETNYDKIGHCAFRNSVLQNNRLTSKSKHKSEVFPPKICMKKVQYILFSPKECPHPLDFNNFMSHQL